MSGAAAAVHPDGSRRHPVRRARTVVTVLVVLVVLVVGGAVVVDQRQEMLAALREVGVLPAVAALLLTTAGVVMTGECWRVWLGSLCTPPPWHVSHRLFYVTQAGKYVPGAVWPYAAQAALAHRYGISRTAVLTASTLFLLTHLGTGVVVGVLGLGSLTTLTPRQGLLYAIGAAAIVCLLPPVLGTGLRLLGRVRPWLVVGTPTWGTTGRAVVVMLLAWACYGLSLFAIAVPLGVGPDALRLLVGTFAAAWVAGFAAVAAPVGIGAREAVVALLLGPAIGAGAALTMAVMSRLALTVADLGLAAVSASVLRDTAPRPAAGPEAPAGTREAGT